MTTRTVRVRVNAAGERLVGEYDLPADPYYRFSDVLNEPREFLKVRRLLSASATGTGRAMAIRKDSVCYVEALEEQPVAPRVFPGTFQQVTVTFSDHLETLEGELFVPASNDVMDILNDPRPFISVRNACFVDSKLRHAFLAVGKRRISMLCV